MTLASQKPDPARGFDNRVLGIEANGTSDRWTVLPSFSLPRTCQWIISRHMKDRWRCTEFIG
jgi:hypothetical protein